MRLVNFSDEPIQFDPNRAYTTFETGLFKPSGLWLSNEDDYGWKEWCRDNGFMQDCFAYEQEFELTPDNNVLIITEEHEFLAFEKKYGVAMTPMHTSIDWNRVRDDYDGIIIPHYFWQFRLDHIWYYGWDCASGCVWNLKAIKPK